MKTLLSVITAMAALTFVPVLYAGPDIKADNVIDMAQSKVSYDIKTVEGEDLVITADYVSTRPNPEIVNMDIAPRNAVKEGTRSFKVKTKEGTPIDIQFIYSGGERVGMKVSAEPSSPASDAEYTQNLSVESKGGYTINFTFIWQGKDLKEVRIEPLINPF